MEDMESQIELLKNALKFYSNEDYYYDDDIASDGTVYKFTTIEEDSGKLARETLMRCERK